MFVWWAAFFFAGVLFHSSGANAGVALGVASVIFFYLPDEYGQAVRSRAFLTAATGLFVFHMASLSPIDTGILNGSSGAVLSRQSGFPGPARYVRERIISLTEEKRMTDRTRGLLRALLIADKKALPVSVRDEWRKTGTAHYLALSGLHLGLIAVPLFGILTLAGARGGLRDLSAVFVLSFYAAVAGRPGSLLRALSMITVIRASRLAGIRTGPGRCVLAGAFLVCMLDPLSLCDTGFLLSFNAAAGVALLGVPVCRSFKRCIARVRGWKSLQFPLIALLMSVCVQASMLPLTVRIFGTAPLSGPLMSVIMALPVTLLLYGGFFHIIAGHLLPSVTVPVLNMLSDLSSGIVSRGARLPAAGVLMTDFDIRPYIIGLSIIASVHWVSARKRAILTAGLILLLLSFGPLLSGRWKTSDREIRFTSGGAVLYGGEGGILVLERHISSRSAGFLVRDLRRKGVRRVKTIIILNPAGRFTGSLSSLILDFGPEFMMHSPWDPAETAGGSESVPVRSDTLVETGGIRLLIRAPLVLPGTGARADSGEAALAISPLD